MLARRSLAPARSKRLLALAGDNRLVDQMRRGNELAFEIAFERHGPGILSFCRHMLGSAEEAEDAVQQTFASAWRDLGRGRERQLVLKPWLFAIARNRCLSVLRARREHGELPELATAGLSEEVERRADLRELLRDVAELPYQQREALLLSETGDLSHAAVASVLGCEVARVKSLVFRARSALIARREARATPCADIREQLANLRGGSLRRNELRLHLAECAGCRAYRDEVERQRELLAEVLPVTPAGGFEPSVLAAAGIGGGAAAAGGAGAALGLAGSTLLAKLAVVGVMTGGGVVAGTVVIDQADTPVPRAPATHIRESAPTGGSEDIQRLPPPPPAPVRAAAQRTEPRTTTPPSRERSADGRTRARAESAPVAPDRGVGARHGRRLGHEKQAARDPSRRPVEAPRGVRARGRGPVESAPAEVPVRRGPPEVSPAPAPKPSSPGKAPADPPGRQVAPADPGPVGPPAVRPNGKAKEPKK